MFVFGAPTLAVMGLPSITVISCCFPVIVLCILICYTWLHQFLNTDGIDINSDYVTWYDVVQSMNHQFLSRRSIEEKVR